MRRTLPFSIIALLIWLAASSDARGQEPEGWVATYHGGTGDGLEVPVGIEVDAEGAVYVSGNSGWGVTTVKYDAGGELLWSTHSEGGSAVGMALDSAGNLLVGENFRSGGALVSYDSEGTRTGFARVLGQLWSMVLDASDHLFVVSDSSGSGFRTTRYDSRLVQEWSVSYGSPARSDDGRTVVSGRTEALVLGTDDEGGAHIAGFVRSGNRRFVYTVLKYDSAGELRWETADVPVHASFWPAATAHDEGGNLFVSGQVETCNGGGFVEGFGLVKYDPDGTELWTACHEPPARGTASVTSVVNDFVGNVYLTGSTCDGATCVAIALKYDPDGALLWEAELPLGHPAAMEVGPTGAVIITGTEESCVGQDCRNVYITVKYTPGGQEEWVRALDAPREGESLSRALTVDAAGRVYVAGTASNDYGVVKYDADGTEAWRAFYNTPLERDDTPIGIETATDGHVYVAGSSCDPEGCDWATLKYDPAGNLVWERRIEQAEASAMALDERQNVYVTGRRLVSSPQGLTVKYDAAGQKLWEATIDGVSPSAIGVDFEGNVLVAGGERERVVVKYDSGGVELWCERSAEGGFAGLEVDPSGFVFFAEDRRGGGQGTFIVLLDYDGVELWRARFGNSPEFSIHDLALDSSGNVYATGTAPRCDPICRGRQHTVKYDTEGEVVWTTETPEPGPRPANAALEVDALDNVYLSLESCVGNSPCELITVKYGSDGAEVWLRHRPGLAFGYYSYGDYFSPQPGRIQIDSAGHVYVHGLNATVKYDSTGNELWLMDLPDVADTFLVLSSERIHLASRRRGDYLIMEDSRNAFHLEPERGAMPLEVRVRASELATPLAVETTHVWDFGDGGAAGGGSAAHTYERAGAFEIELVSSNALVETRKLRRVDVACFDGEVSPWSSTDLGRTGFQGRARIENAGGSPALEICTGGIDINGAEDAFHFVYQEVTGDVLLTARVSALTDGYARVGVMLRESLEPSARHASVVLDHVSSTRFRFLVREEAAGSTRSSPAERVEVPDAWVRIGRRGGELIGSTSLDGVEWTEVGRVVLDIPEKILAGFAASARVLPGEPAADPISVTLDQLALVLDPDPLETPFQRGDANADGAVNLTDATVVLSALFGGQAGAVTCEKSADANDSGALEISDSIYLLAHLFQSGPPPAAPFEACGVDPSPDALSCVSYAGCE